MVSPPSRRLQSVLGGELWAAVVENDHAGLRRLVDRMEEDQLVQLHRSGSPFSGRTKHRVLLGNRIHDYLIETYGMTPEEVRRRLLQSL